MINKIYKLLRIARFWIAIKFPTLRKKVLTEYEDERLILFEFRANAAFFGFPIDNMTDDELIKGVAACHAAISKVGLTAEESCKAIETMRETTLKTCIND